MHLQFRKESGVPSYGLSANDIAPLSPEFKRKLLPYAKAALWLAALFVAWQIVMQIAILAPYPGINDDPVMRSLSHTMFFVTGGTIIKTFEVMLLGSWVERILGTNRKVELKGIFNKEIQWDSFLGALCNAFYSILFIALVHDLTPTALGAGRACMIILLAAMELGLRILPREKRTYLRLLVSLPLTILGASIIIFAKGADFTNGNASALWVFLVLITVGNFSLAYAEIREYRGVHKRNTAAPVYTLSRCVWYSVITIVAVIVWGAYKGDYHTAWAVAQMYTDRWYLIFPIALFWGLIDLIRISAKVIVSTTYIYVIGAAAVALELLVQTIARIVAPTIYHQIPPDVWFVVICAIGAFLIYLGSRTFPHPKTKEEELLPERPLP